MQAPTSTKANSTSPSDMGCSLYRMWTCKTVKAGETDERFCKQLFKRIKRITIFYPTRVANNTQSYILGSIHYYVYLLYLN